MLRATRAALSFHSLSFGLLLSLTPAAAEASVAGVWKLSYEEEGQPKEYVLDLKQDGEKVTGLLVSPRSGRKDDFHGSFKDHKLTFEVKRQNNETFAVEATLKSPERMEGKLAINGEGSHAVVIERPQASPVVGKWNVVTKSPDGNQEYASTLEITEAEGKLAGKAHSQLGTTEIRSPTLAGHTFSYELTLNLEGNDVAFIVNAELKERNKLVGKWKARDADFTGDWSATREVAAAAAAPAPAPAEPKPAPAPAAATAPAKGLAGKWHGVATTPNGEKRSLQIELALDGNTVTGKLSGEHGARELRDGKASGKKLQFAFDIEVDGNKVNIAVELELDDHEVLRGQWKTGDASGDLVARKPVTL